MSQRLLCLAILGVHCLTQPFHFAHAQTPEDQEVVPLYDLKSALPFVNWDSKAHGPLIAIQPDKILWISPAAPVEIDSNFDPETFDTSILPLYPPKDRYGYNADFIARYYDRKLIHFPTLTIFAPTKILRLNTDLKPANPYKEMSTYDKMLRLEVSLTPAQWQLLGSDAGLGIGDLTAAQQPIFEDLLPEQMTLQQQTVKEDENGRVYGNGQDSAEQTLTDEQKSAVRIHLIRHANFHLVSAKSFNIGMFGPFHSEAIGAKKMAVVAPQGKVAEGNRAESSGFGQTLRYETPNRLKPSDLDLTQPLLQNTTVPLIGVKTVGDLLHAVQAKTGVELYADGRLAQLVVSVSADNCAVRAADVLGALCWALGATYRKVGPVPGGSNPNDFAYVLTYDRMGLSAIHGMISDWAQRGKTERETNEANFLKALEKIQPGKYVSYATGDPMAPTDAALKAMRESAKSKADDPNKHYWPNTVPVGSLTPVQRQQMNEGFKILDKMRERDPGTQLPSLDKVSLLNSVGISFVIPGVGEVSEGTTWDDFDDLYGQGRVEPDAQPDDPNADASADADTLAKLKQEPVSVPHAILCFAPKSLSDAEQILASARGWGISRVWVQTPDTADGLQLLNACVASGKKHGVAVGAQVPVVTFPAVEGATTPAFEDLNVFGETYSQWATHLARQLDGLDSPELLGAIIPQCVPDKDVCAPDSAATHERLSRRLKAIGVVPGLADVALFAAMVPGRDWWQGNSDGPSYGEPFAGKAFGYTVANRLALLRAKGYDPIDIEGRSDGGDDLQLREATSLPGYDVIGNATDIHFYGEPPRMGEVQAAWAGLCNKSPRDLLSTLRAEIRTSHPQLPVYLGLHGSPGEGDYGYQCWNNPRPIPFATPDENGEKLPEFVFDGNSLTSMQDEIKDLQSRHADLKGLTVGKRMAVSIRDTVKANPDDHQAASTGIVLDFTAIDASDIPAFLTGALLPVGAH